MILYVTAIKLFTYGDICFASLFKGCALLVLLILSGCSETESFHSDEYLVRVQESVLMVLDFQREFETIKVAYSLSGNEQNASVFRDAKKQLLNQMIEELILVERAKELNISVKNSELEEAVRKIRKDYPEGEFEKMLLEYSISYNMWEKKLRMRMIIDKVIAEDLKNNIEITADDLSKYYRENIGNDSNGKSANEPTTEIIIKNLRNIRAEQAYKAWFEGLQKKYKIEINNKQWKTILSS